MINTYSENRVENDHIFVVCSFCSFWTGYDMSTFVRRYANYLNEKAGSYREMGYDFCRLKRG